MFWLQQGNPLLWRSKSGRGCLFANPMNPFVSFTVLVVVAVTIFFLSPKPRVSVTKWPLWWGLVDYKQDFFVRRSAILSMVQLLLVDCLMLKPIGLCQMCFWLPTVPRRSTKMDRTSFDFGRLACRTAKNLENENFSSSKYTTKL